jgi:hypothetical protein
MMNSSLIGAQTSYPMNGIDNLPLHEIIEPALDLKSSSVVCIGIGVKAVCNYDCVYCYAGHSEKKGDLSTEQYLDVVSQAAEIGVKTIILTGAGGKSEPGLFKGLLPILDAASAKGINTAIFTNGSAFGDDKVARVHGLTAKAMAQRIRELNCSLFVACETMQPELYLKITKKPYAEFELGLQNLIDAGFVTRPGSAASLTFSSVVMRENFEELPSLKEFAHRHGWQYICKFPTLAGSALDHLPLFFTPQEAAERHDVIASIRDKPETLTVVHNGKEYCLVSQVGMSFDNLGAPLNCLSGREITDRREVNLKSMRLADIVSIRKELASMGAGNCPKKAAFYEFKQDKKSFSIPIRLAPSSS